jgi:ribosomal protein S18 acetylase RimI-like enzyme
MSPASHMTHEAGMTYHIRDATPADAPALADTVIEPIITTFRGRVPDQCLSWLTKEESIANWQRWFQSDGSDGEFLLVAELMEGSVVGCALGGPQPDDPQFHGEFYLLGVLSAYQGRGIGRHLVKAVAARLLQQGIQSMQVGVLTVNPNRHFYERLGGRYVRERPYDWNGVLFSEAIYGWTDLTGLLAS